MEGVNRTFFFGSVLPFIVVDSVRHKSPAYTGVEAKSKAEEYLSYDVAYKSYRAVAEREEEEECAEYANRTSDSASFLFAPSVKPK